MLVIYLFYIYVCVCARLCVYTVLGVELKS